MIIYRMGNVIDIERLASLARLYLGDGERERYRADLEKIIGYVNELADVDVADTEPPHHVLGLTNVLRSDDAPVRNEELAKKLIDMAPKSKDGFLCVPRVLYHEG